MDLSLDVPLDVVETTLLASVRIVAFLAVAPPFANKGVPGPVKVALGLGLGIGRHHLDAGGSQPFHPGGKCRESGG